MPERILTIFAHPDDAECAAGGALLDWAAAGHEIVMALVTSGDKGSNDPHETPEQVIRKRRREQADAAAMLGARVIDLGWEDGALQPTMELRHELVKLVRTVRPTRVLTHDPTVWFRHDIYINHPDHRAAGQAVLEALYPAVKKPSAFPDLLAAGLEPHVVDEIWLGLTDHPNTWIDISERIDDKIRLICRHASQFPPEATHAAFTRIAREDGEARGYAYAEGFRVLRLVRQTVQAFAALTEE
jgi:LmbE family N-acetylglucosaminyl deacetylase